MPRRQHGHSLFQVGSLSYGSQAQWGSNRQGGCKKKHHGSGPVHRHERAVSARERCFVTGIACIVVLGMLTSCEQTRRENSSRLRDFSYANHRGHSCGPNALDVPVGLEDFVGSFLWLDYAAPWCSPCLLQAKVLHSLDESASDGVVFLTLLTSGDEPLEEATQSTAAAWAHRHGLDPSRVVASNEIGRTIPQHTLFSPLGQTLYHAIGYHTEAQIRAIIRRQVDTWRQRHPEVTEAN